MKLTYRGIQYDEKDRNSSISAGIADKEIIYRGNTLEAGINSKFPLIKFIKQLFNKPKANAVFNPIAFWHEHKREFLEYCWHLDQIELDRCWDLTLQAERTKALKSQQKTKLKYRGITYYR